MCAKMAAAEVYASSRFTRLSGASAKYFREWTRRHNINTPELGAKQWHLEEASIYALYRYIDCKWGDMAGSTKRMVNKAKGKRVDDLAHNTLCAITQKMKDGTTYMVNAF